MKSNRSHLKSFYPIKNPDDKIPSTFLYHLTFHLDKDLKLRNS